MFRFVLRRGRPFHSNRPATTCCAGATTRAFVPSAAARCATVSRRSTCRISDVVAGLNVLADGGSYLYNGPQIWHHHFMGTSSHNTIELDGRDQMLHVRQFKTAYWTRASLRRFEDRQDWALIEGEHHGYRRHGGRCIHRRAVLMLKDDVWVVVDRIDGHGDHDVRLHWLCGDFPFAADEANGALTLTTPKDFQGGVFDGEARLRATVVAAGEQPPRGCGSRAITGKVAVLVVEQRVPCRSLSAVLAGTAFDIVPRRAWQIAFARLTMSTIGDPLQLCVVQSNERRTSRRSSSFTSTIARGAGLRLTFQRNDERLGEQGHEVTVVAGVVDYATESFQNASTPMDRPRTGRASVCLAPFCPRPW